MFLYDLREKSPPAGPYNVRLPTFPEGTVAPVRPRGPPDPPRYSDLSQLRYRDASRVRERIADARQATARRLEELEL